MRRVSEMVSQNRLVPPPHTHTADGHLRRVGVEIEFGGIDARDSADIVARLFGGCVKEQDPHRFLVEDTTFGCFVVELDSQFAHPAQVDLGPPADGLERDLAELRENLDRWASEMAGNIASAWLPTEIVSPPIPLDRLTELFPLVEHLRQNGAQSTADSVFYAFGLQLNPEVVAVSADYIRRHLQAYLLLSDRLRQEIDIDTTRSILSFAAPFPERYCRQVLDCGYTPDMTRLIDDYLLDNPTRNRELDLLPLFSMVNSQRVADAVADSLVKARPTFHWRLPDANFRDPGWGIHSEWNRWVQVEWLAENPQRLQEGFALYRRAIEEGNWLERLVDWLEVFDWADLDDWPDSRPEEDR